MPLFFYVSSKTNTEVLMLVVIHCGAVCNSKMWKGKWSHSVLSDSATPWTVAYQAPPSMDFPGKSTGAPGPFLPQGIIPTQGSNLGLLHCRQLLYHLSHKKISQKKGGMHWNLFPSKKALFNTAAIVSHI